ncbi:hypothetical protein [Caulifigura coniformis]|uniref:hypothetical protein n=1 Tax=Caulifigura coniformis TaxID=2527983 RepID=UPI0011A82325|nr:hypothetical protein [Caulifigura coniformis]
MRSSIGRLFVLALLWQGPVPVFHSHAAFSDPHKLADHLCRCHCGDARTLSEIAQLPAHVHFLPRQGTGDEIPSDPAGSSAAGGACFLAVGGQTALDGALDWHLRGEASGGDIVSEPAVASAVCPVIFDHGGAFLTDYATHLALPVRLGVLRC